MTHRTAYAAASVPHRRGFSSDPASQTTHTWSTRVAHAHTQPILPADVLVRSPLPFIPFFVFVFFSTRAVLHSSETKGARARSLSTVCHQYDAKQRRKRTTDCVQPAANKGNRESYQRDKRTRIQQQKRRPPLSCARALNEAPPARQRARERAGVAASGERLRDSRGAPISAAMCFSLSEQEHTQQPHHKPTRANRSAATHSHSRLDAN